MGLSNSRSVLLVSLISLLNGWGFILLNPAYPSIATDLQVNPQLVSLIISMYALPGIFVTPLYGFLADRIGRKKVILPLVFIFGVAGVMAGFSPDFLSMLLLRVIQGIAVAAFYPLTFIIIGDLFTGDQRSYAVGLVFTINMGIGAIMPILGGILTEISWRLIYFSFGIAFPIFIAAYFILPETNPHFSQESSVSEVKPEIVTPMNEPEHSMLPNLAIIGAIFLGIFYFMITFGAWNLFTSFYIEVELGNTPFFTGILLTGQSVLITVFNTQTGRLMSRYSKPILALVAFILLAAGCMCFVFPPMYLWLYLGIIITGFSMGIAFSVLNAYVLDVAPPEKRGFVTSLFQTGIKFGQTTGPYLFATMYTLLLFQIWAPFATGVVISIIAAVITLPLITYTKRTGKGLPEIMQRP